MTAGAGRLAAILLLAAACQERRAPAEFVVRRAEPRDFGESTGQARPAVVQIGDQAREVVRAPTRIAIERRRGVVPKDGEARLELALSDEVRALPDEAFELALLAIPVEKELAEDTLQALEERSRLERRESGWSIERTPEGAALDITGLDERAQLLVHLDAIGPSPLRLESRELDVPAGARLELAHGSLVPSRASTFRATLLCEDAEPRTIHESRYEASQAELGAWTEVSAELGERTARCRLHLKARDDEGKPLLGAVWAVPRLLVPRPDPAASPPPNIVLISLDTLRADHMSAYGYARETTPIIDRELVAKGTTFTDASTTFPRTDIAHLSLFTGVYADVPPVRGRLAATSPMQTLPELLQEAGYETTAFTEDALIGGAFGFWYGYDRFSELPFDSSERGREVFARGIEALRRNRDRRFFLFLHTYKTHNPWVAEDEAAGLWMDGVEWKSGRADARIPEELRANVDAYDRTIREADAMVGELLTALDTLDLAAGTLVVLLSDHGEAFGEHGVTGHGFSFHQEQLRVPFIVRGPGVPAGKRIAEPVSLVDVAPTLLDLAGATPLPDGQGLSLRGALAGEPLDPARLLFFAWGRPGTAGFRRGAEKVARAGGRGIIYRLDRDPLEDAPARGVGPLGRRENALIDRYLVDAARRRALHAAKTRDEPGVAVSERTGRSLRALGYAD